MKKKNFKGGKQTTDVNKNLRILKFFICDKTSTHYKLFTT